MFVNFRGSKSSYMSHPGPLLALALAPSLAPALAPAPSLAIAVTLAPAALTLAPSRTLGHT